ncbi:MAG: polymerase, sigma-24 subunit, subfamily [Marmoricola sp.]|jgi:RNA polymerase sigma-70 factor (sigma-E family)|nr:polymerase, sigma-24 subunit, subfamily [Marmoricola sp.]
MGVKEHESRRDRAFDEFAASAWPRLRWTAYLLSGDHHLAEDLAQTALVKTYAAWRRVRPGEAYSYARRTLVNTNIDRLRRRRFREVADDGHDASAHRVEGRTGDQTEGVDDADLIVRLLSRLSERERRILVLRHYWDLSEAAVADELGISIGTVKSTTSRALAKVRETHPELVSTRGLS